MTDDARITYVNDLPVIPTHLGTDAPHVHHRGSDRCLRAPEGVACPTPAELRAEVARLRAGLYPLSQHTIEWAEGLASDIGASPDSLFVGWINERKRAESAEAERDALQQQVASVQAPGPKDARMGAYYYSFDPTGVGIIDAILSAVAHAGKAFHHTDMWTEEWHRELPDGGATPEEGIQHAADAAARTLAALGGPAAPTPEPTIADHDGFGAPIMDHAQEPQPTDAITRCGSSGGHGSPFGHECRCVRQAGHPLDSDRPHGCGCGAPWSCPGCEEAEPYMGCGECGSVGSPGDDMTIYAARQQEPGERITDARGDELEHGADTDAEAANQPKCTCVPFPQGTGPEEDCPVHGARQQGGGDR